MYDVRVALKASVVSLLLLLVVSVTLSHAEFRALETAFLQVTFLDVGQGDATFIQSTSGTQVLIDGGRDASVLGELQKILGFFDKDIDMILATHPDADHIGGLIDVLAQYDVGTIVMTENIGDSPVYEVFLKAVKEEGANVLYARAGQIYSLGAGEAGSTTMRILFPDHDPTYLESNTSSVIAQLAYGDIEYVLTGDSPQSIEEYLVTKEGATLQSEVLKIGHHGSKTSTSELFLKTVAPTYGIISAGKDNSYGHPHKVVTDLLNTYNVLHKNTADFGSISSYSDGVRVWFK